MHRATQKSSLVFVVWDQDVLRKLAFEGYMCRMHADTNVRKHSPPSVTVRGGFLPHIFDRCYFDFSIGGGLAWKVAPFREVHFLTIWLIVYRC